MIFYDIEIFSDAHPEYLEDDSDHKEAVAEPTEASKPVHEDKPAHDESAHDETTEAIDIEGSVQQEWIFRIVVFGAVLTGILWYTRRRRNGYDALKQDEKHNV